MEISYKKLLYLLLITLSCSKDNLKQLLKPDTIIKTLNVTDIGSSNKNTKIVLRRIQNNESQENIFESDNTGEPV